MIKNSTKKSPSMPLKIGLISDSTQISVYVRDLVQWAKNEPGIELKHYILHKAPPSSETKTKSKISRLWHSLKKHGLRKTISNVLFQALTWFEFIKLKRNQVHINHLDKYNILDFGLTILKINPVVSKLGTVHEFSEDDIQKITLLELDLMLICGLPILCGSILTTCKFGILSIHCGDYFQYRGCPEGFWEVLNEADNTGFVINKLADNMGNGIVYFHGLMETKGSWLFNQANIYSQSFHYFKEFLKKLGIAKKLPNPLPVLPYSRTPHTMPDMLDTIRYAWIRLKNRAKNSVKSQSVWNVAFVHSHWRDASLYEGIPLPALPGKGLADPFVYSKDGKEYCFVEEIDEANSKGSIVVYELFQTSAIRLGTVLDENFHLSFPYIFEYEGQLLMLPESHQNQDIRLYECIDFPLQWKLKHIIMNNISAVDTLLFHKDNKWWIFTNTNQSNDPGHFYEMVIFSADSPFEKEWTPHPLNPVYVDASRARNGGFFQSDNKFYRVSQAQGIDNYGKSATINEIIELTDGSFREVRIANILPYFKKGIKGTHHFHTNGPTTVFDFNKS